MRIAVIILACFLFIPLSGQKKWERLSRKFEKKYEQSEFDAALDAAFRILEYSLENHDSIDSRYALSHFYVAKAYDGLGDPGGAKPYIKLAYEKLVPNIAYDDHMAGVYRLYGKIETGLGYHKSASLLLSRALEISLELYGTESQSYLLSLYAMADLEMAMAHWDQMAGLLSEALQIHERNFPRDYKYTLYANYLGLLFMNSEHNQEAILYLNKSLLAYQSPGLKEDLTCANAHNNLGLIRYYQSEYEDAAMHFEHARIIYLKLTEGYSENYMMLLSNRASLYYSWGKTAMLESSSRALGEYLDLFAGRTDLPYIQGLENMANFCENAGNFEEAEAFSLRAVQARKSLAEGESAF